MKTKIISFLVCILFLSSCKDDEPNFIFEEGEIEYSTDSPEWYPNYPEINLLYSQNFLYENIIQTIIDTKDVSRQEITITEIKLKSSILIPDDLSDEEFMKVESGTYDVIERVGTGINTISNFIEIGELDLTNSSKTELTFQPKNINLLAYLDRRFGETFTSFRKNFEFNSSAEPNLRFEYFQNIYSYKYKIQE